MVHQFKYSMIEKTNQDVLDSLDEWGIGGVAFSPLAQGILTGKYINGIPEGSRAASTSQFLRENDITDSVVDITRKLSVIAENRGQSLAQMSLAWALNHKNMTSLILGASRLSQLQENVSAIRNLEFTKDELEEINRILK